jgi:Immunity protein 26
MPKVKYQEGDWFAVPLRDGGFGIVLVARAARDGVLLGYFFGPRRSDVPMIGDVTGLKPDDAVLVRQFGDLGIIRGQWPALGHLEGWDRAEWPMPIFVRYEELTGRSFRVYYDDDDPNSVPREEQIPPGEAEQGPKDGLMGFGFAEKTLTQLLSAEALSHQA